MADLIAISTFAQPRAARRWDKPFKGWARLKRSVYIPEVGYGESPLPEGSIIQIVKANKKGLIWVTVCGEKVGLDRKWLEPCTPPPTAWDWLREPVL